MKKAILFCAILVLSSLSAYAIEREFRSDTGNSGGHTLKNAQQPGQTNFERIGVSANQVAGNMGYVAFNVPDPAGVYQPYYLWVEADGKLCLASYPSISTYSSFPTGDWRTGMPCTVVGGQS